MRNFELLLGHGNVRLAKRSAIMQTPSISFQSVVIQISTGACQSSVYLYSQALRVFHNAPSESSEHRRLPDDPNLWTRMSWPGHSSLKIFSSFVTIFFRFSSTDGDGSNLS